MFKSVLGPRGCQDVPGGSSERSIESVLESTRETQERSLLEVLKESPDSSIKEPTRTFQEKSMRSMKRVLEFPTESLECSSKNLPECAKRKGRTHHQERVRLKRISSRGF